MILVKNDMDAIELDFLRNQFHEEVIGIEIKGKQRQPALTVVTYYNPPGQPINDKIFENNIYPGPNIIITGDLNCKNKTWGSNITDALGQGLKDTLEDQNWHILNDGSKTRCHPVTGKEETLDLIMSSPQMFKMGLNFSVGEDIGSDHYPLHLNIVFDRHRPEAATYYRNESQTDWPLFKEMVANGVHELPDNPQTKEELDVIAEKLTATVRNAFEEACPLKQKLANKRSVTPDIMKMIKDKRKLRRMKSSASARGDWSGTQNIQKEINKIGNQIKKAQKVEEKRQHETACSNLAKENNPRKFFQSIRKITGGTNKGDGAFTRKIKDELGNIASTAQERVDLFANRLKHVHQTPDFVCFNDGWKISIERFIAANDKIYTTDPISKYLDPEDGDNSPLLVTPTGEEIQGHLRKCKPKSAAGLDGIGYNLLKRVPPPYITYITKFFGACLRVGYFPKEWKHAKTIMIPKPDKDLSLAKNYRPISLLSCLGKLFERLLAGRLSLHLEERGLFNKNQSGFRKGKMTSDQLLRLVEESHLGFKKRQATASLFLDAEAAFDKCWHDGVRYKLKELLHLPNRTIRILSSFLSDRTLQVFEKKHLFRSH